MFLYYLGFAVLSLSLVVYLQNACSLIRGIIIWKFILFFQKYFSQKAPSNFCSSLKFMLEALLFLVDSFLAYFDHTPTHKEINSSRFYWHSEWSLK